MKIERILKKIKNVLIYFDEGEPVKIRYEVAVKNGLRKRDLISPEGLKKLLNENRKYLIKETTWRYLSNRAHSLFELRTKLRRKYPDASATIEEVLSEFAELNLIDDEKFARDFAEARLEINKVGPLRIKAELIKKGIKREIAERTVEELFENRNTIDLALDLANKKLRQIRRPNLPPEKKKLRIYGFLKNRGFSNEVIYNVLKMLNFQL